MELKPSLDIYHGRKKLDNKKNFFLYFVVFFFVYDELLFMIYFIEKAFLILNLLVHSVCFFDESLNHLWKK